ncbi:TlpA family protein disulfide reductase [Actinocorallia populi]|uniref:TlpA family protein disulfide reductase n=1 Tax=Actinocorallia populi TaxID=2079200 RepID=UPI000D087167|nr:TlpA disulfide reductase family protein [Actinocorallia populi]
MIRRAVAPALLAAAALMLAAGCSGGGTAAEPGEPIPAGDRRSPAAAVAGETLEGEPLDLASYEGKVVVVNFWASWCGPCRAEAPALEATYQENKDEVAFLGVDIKDTRDGAKAFVRKYGSTYPSLFDPEGKITHSFSSVNPSALPTTLILDREGRVAVQFPGIVHKSRLDPALAKIVAEK